MDITQLCYNGQERLNIEAAEASCGAKADRQQSEKVLSDNLKEISEQIDRLYAAQREGLLVIFQAMDAGGKDGVIRRVFGPMNPLGVRVHSFKEPAQNELAHDYLWRVFPHLPARGSISVFNRSYYEDVLIAKVHRLYEKQNLPLRCIGGDVILNRYRQIRDFELYMWENGIRVVKIFLNISKKEQKKRFLKRIDTEDKNWKFAESDLKERAYWHEYQKAYEDAINATATEVCPWYVVPADQKWYARTAVSEILRLTLAEMDPEYPEVSQKQKEMLQSCREKLEQEKP